MNFTGRGEMLEEAGRCGRPRRRSGCCHSGRRGDVWDAGTAHLSSFCCFINFYLMIFLALFALFLRLLINKR